MCKRLITLYLFLLATLILTSCAEQTNDALSDAVSDAVNDAIETTTAETPTNNRADADVTFVRAVLTAAGTWTFHVTVNHPDTGWDDYANGWNVLLPDGTIVRPAGSSDPFTRLLLHPHETEQPFTRSQSNLVIPDGITQVTVQAHDTVDQFGGAEIIVDLLATTINEDDGFVVERP